jgi:hypothetical protein
VSYMGETLSVPTGYKRDRANHPNRKVGRANSPSTGQIVDIPKIGPAQVTKSGKRYFLSETVSSRRPIKETGVGLVKHERL